LVYFDAKPSGAAVNCSWQTAAEINNDYFSVERSTNGKDFITIENIDGAGNSSSAINYSFSDEHPLQGTSYYRLKQTDFDGHCSISEIKSVSINPAPAVIAINSVSPNPFKESFSINYFVQDDAAVSVAILNSSGQVVYDEKQTTVKGNNHFDFNEGMNLNEGIYFVKLTVNNYSQLKKIVKTN